MIQAWYEKVRDRKDDVYFALHKTERGSSERGYRVPGFHNSIELAFCLQGDLEIEIGGVSYVLNEGEVCFVNSLEPHRYYYEGKSVKCYVVVISSSFFNDFNRLAEISFPTHMPACEGFATVRKYLDYVFDEWDADSILCKRAFVDMLMYLMMRYYPFVPKNAPEKQSVKLLEAVKYICENCTKRLTVGDIAARFGYSANYFSTAFNEFMGTSFPDYLNACRMIECQRLLARHSEISAVRAAEMCGFGSMNTFYRARKRFEEEQDKQRFPIRREFS